MSTKKKVKVVSAKAATSMLYWQSKTHSGSYPVTIVTWTKILVVFIDRNNAGRNQTITMTPTTSGLKLHSHLNSSANPNWNTYIGVFGKTCMDGDWVHPTGAFGGNGTFKIVP